MIFPFLKPLVGWFVIWILPVNIWCSLKHDCSVGQGYRKVIVPAEYPLLPILPPPSQYPQSFIFHPTTVQPPTHCHSTLPHILILPKHLYPNTPILPILPIHPTPIKSTSNPAPQPTILTILSSTASSWPCDTHSNSLPLQTYPPPYAILSPLLQPTLPPSPLPLTTTLSLYAPLPSSPLHSPIIPTPNLHPHQLLSPPCLHTFYTPLPNICQPYTKCHPWTLIYPTCHPIPPPSILSQATPLCIPTHTYPYPINLKLTPYHRSCSSHLHSLFYSNSTFLLQWHYHPFSYLHSQRRSLLFANVSRRSLSIQKGLGKGSRPF